MLASIFAVKKINKLLCFTNTFKIKKRQIFEALLIYEILLQSDFQNFMPEKVHPNNLT